VTLDDALEVALEDYIRSQEAKPSLTAVVQAALQQFLHCNARSTSVLVRRRHRQAKEKNPK
jgi:hypothetical protein